MSYNLKLRLGIALFLAFMTFLSVRIVNRPLNALNLGFDKQKYKSFGNNLILPTWLAYWTTIYVVADGWGHAAEHLLIKGFGILLSLTVYYIILLPLLPFFRRHFRARTCALLWVLPNFLYFYLLDDAFPLKRPLLVLPVPLTAVKAAGLIWLTGFAAVLAWKIGSHLWFRHQIVDSSHEITDETILELWKEEQLAAGMSELLPMKPVISPMVRTPLSIGLMHSTTLLVLPEKSYTTEELILIFRLDIIHIQRKDASSKLFMAFCGALCWFNPFLWKSMRACSADMELSCDETVLLDEPEETRQQYARLILHTAGNARGFTTCLSASAESLRYRLRKITAPVSLRKGGLTLALITLLLFMSVGHVALSYEQFPASDILPGKISTAQVSSIQMTRTTAGGSESKSYQCTDPAALQAYIESLELHKITGYYEFTDCPQSLHIHYADGSTDGYHLYLQDGSLLAGETDWKSWMDTWYIMEDIDWDYIGSLLTPVNS